VGSSSLNDHIFALFSHQNEPDSLTATAFL